MSQDNPALSLLSLSIAASNAAPIPLPDPAANGTSKHPALHHRRLSSTGRRRRLSDARDAAIRPGSVATPALSMAALSLSTSASPPAQAHAMPASAPTKSSTPIPIAHTPATAGRKKRGVDHKCEACSKIYRHPSCLIKHRWEHTPHWRTLSSLPHLPPAGTSPPSKSAGKYGSASAGKYASGGGGSASKYAAGAVLSKHAQVQMLEAAAILSHLSPDSDTGTSLPEDRGMWPRWVSGGGVGGGGGVCCAGVWWGGECGGTGGECGECGEGGAGELGRGGGEGAWGRALCDEEWGWAWAEDA
ncbi:hypothetical protein C8J57DRAFT_1719214 [Mycena rebaudengoi]|nr:hypothetical protein C8J57DRAFT_1719214 [Mycena rebaudengoi]